MALVNTTLSCSGTGNASVAKAPIRIINATGTITVTLLKIPLKVLSSSAFSSTVISLLRFGIDTFDVIEIKRKWFISNVGKWEVKISKRFGFMTRGRPSG